MFLLQIPFLQIKSSPFYNTIFPMRLSSFILSIFVSITVFAQSDPDQKLIKPRKIMIADTSYMEVIYSYKVYDDYYKLQQDFHEILEIGNNCSYYSNYGYYRLDSLMNVDYPNGIKRIDYRSLRQKTHPRTDLSILKNKNEGKLTGFGFILMDHYIYEETIPQMKWTLLPDSEEICGYKCYKAITNFRGRQWEAWYTDEIPLNYGPWKLGNLPGLILKAQDITNDHIFEALAVRKSNKPFGPAKYRFIRTEREKFNETNAEFRNNPNLFLTGTVLAPKDKEGNEMKGQKMFYNPLELE